MSTDKVASNTQRLVLQATGQGLLDGDGAMEPPSLNTSQNPNPAARHQLPMQPGVITTLQRAEHFRQLPAQYPARFIV